MVAASGEKEGFSSRTAVLCFAGIVVSIAIMALPTLTAGTLYDKASIDIPPDVLAFRAQDILKEFGYTEKPRSTAHGFECCNGPDLRYVEQFPPARRDALLASHQPPLVRFWYRQSQSPLVADAPDSVSYDSPPNSEPRMIRMALDATGRLTALEARPGAESLAAETPAVLDWGMLLKEARLEPARFKPSDPRRTPPMAFDARMAWVGTYDENHPEQIHVEAAAWQGRPVYFDISGEWRKTGESTDYRPPALTVVFACVFGFLVAGAALVARQNLRLGRGDKKGAARIAVAAFLSGFASFLVGTSHVAGIEEVQLFVVATGFIGFISGMLWLLVYRDRTLREAALAGFPDLLEPLFVWEVSRSPGGVPSPGGILPILGERRGYLTSRTLAASVPPFVPSRASNRWAARPDSRRGCWASRATRSYPGWPLCCFWCFSGLSCAAYGSQTLWSRLYLSRQASRWISAIRCALPPPVVPIYWLASGLYGCCGVSVSLRGWRGGLRMRSLAPLRLLC